MVWKPRGFFLDNPLSVYVDNEILEYVKEVKYLGYILTCNSMDDEGFRLESHSLCITGKTLLRKFNFEVLT